MILVWRGWGLLGVAALFLPLASCAGLMDTRPGLALLLGGLALAGGGVACWVCGRRWNRPATRKARAAPGPAFSIPCPSSRKMPSPTTAPTPSAHTAQKPRVRGGEAVAPVPRFGHRAVGRSHR